jgi:molybdate transport system substrate-binding protein
MKLKAILFILMVLMTTTVRAETELSISAAASLKDAFTEIKEGFEKENPGVKVLLNFAGSGQLQAQIEMGAPVDVFASASRKEVDALVKKELVEPKTVKIFAQNELVLIKNSGNSSKIGNLEDLKAPEVKKIAIGNPATVPAGKYAAQALEFYKMGEGLKDKLIPCENVRQVLDYVERNEVDAGFVFSTDAKIGKNIEVAAAIPPDSHEEIVYPICIVGSSKLQELSKKFVKYILKHKEVLKKYGFKA